MPFDALETRFLVPLIILLGVSALLSIILSQFKIRIIPTFVLEILVGIVLGVVLKDFFIDNGFEENVNVLYVLGFSIILFISGFDIDMEVFNDKQPVAKSHLNIRFVSLFLIGMVYIASIVVSIFFTGMFDKKIEGIILLTIAFASTFAGIVAPLITVERMNRTGWGNLMISYSFISELLSIVLLTIYMIVSGASFSGLWSYGVIIVVFLLLLLGLRLRSNRKMTSGMVFIKTRIVVLALAIVILFGEMGGGEYVLGAFLLGFLLKSIGVKGHYLHTIEQIGYGIFIPIFFVIVGMRIDIAHFFDEPKLFLIVGILFVCFLLVRLPFLYLLKWYNGKTVTTSILLSSVTLVVAIAVDHIGVHAHVFSYGFGEAIILAAVLTSIVGPITYELTFIKNLKAIRRAERDMTYGKCE